MDCFLRSRLGNMFDLFEQPISFMLVSLFELKERVLKHGVCHTNLSAPYRRSSRVSAQVLCVGDPDWISADSACSRGSSLSSCSVPALPFA